MLNKSVNHSGYRSTQYPHTYAHMSGSDPSSKEIIIAGAARVPAKSVKTPYQLPGLLSAILCINVSNDDRIAVQKEPNKFDCATTKG